MHCVAVFVDVLHSIAFNCVHCGVFFGVLCTWVQLLTDLQILGCELHKNAFGGRARHRSAVRAIALPQTP